jgi:riboflavin kinase/FMN adenylyltransferase
LNIYSNISAFKKINSVVTIGIFDGVHRGHIEILNRLKELAITYKGESVVITLWPHPRFVLQPHNNELRLLTSLDEKIDLIGNQGIDNLIILPFNRQLANITYDRFVTDYIVGQIGAQYVVVGFNHHFGKDRKGTFENLQVSAREHGIKAERLNQVIIESLRVSSSGIRHMIAEGRITTANKALGYFYFLNGKVVTGNKLGRVLGYPTANIEIDEQLKLLPRNGVYAVLARLKNKVYEGMLSVGVRPTIEPEGDHRVVEVNIFGFDGDLYGQNIKVAFLEWLRCEKKFKSLDELRDQISIDKQEVLRILQNYRNTDKLI